MISLRSCFINSRKPRVRHGDFNGPRVFMKQTLNRLIPSSFFIIRWIETTSSQVGAAAVGSSVAYALLIALMCAWCQVKKKNKE